MSTAKQKLTRCREIVDESDVYVDVHKAIRRLTPAPRARRIEAAAAAAAKKAAEHPVLVDLASKPVDGRTASQAASQAAENSLLDEAGPDTPRTALLMKRQNSVDPNGVMINGAPEPLRESLQDLKQQVRLGPANRAANPLSTRQQVFKTKPGLGGTSGAQPSSYPPPGGVPGELQRTMSANESPRPSMEGRAVGRETEPLLGAETGNSNAKVNGQRG